MKDWRTHLELVLQDGIASLEARGCQFVWRAQVTGQICPVPEDALGACWLEVWKRGQLLDFAAPPTPLWSERGVEAIRALVVQQRHIHQMYEARSW